jgi:hypothetical protein
MIQMVNGYPCRNCSEVSLARRGLDPENPTDDPVKARDIAARHGERPPEDTSRARAPGTGALVDILA